MRGCPLPRPPKRSASLALVLTSTGLMRRPGCVPKWKADVSPGQSQDLPDESVPNRALIREGLCMSAIQERAKEIFLHLLSHIPPQDWNRWLDETHSGDQEVRDRVRVLLRAHEQPGSFLESPAAPVGVLAPTIVQAATERAGM